MSLITGSSVIQKSSSLGTEWQTPVISEAFRSRFSRCSSITDSGDTAIGTSCSDIAEGKVGFVIGLSTYATIFSLNSTYLFTECHLQNDHRVRLSNYGIWIIMSNYFLFFNITKFVVLVWHEYADLFFVCFLFLCYWRLNLGPLHMLGKRSASQT